MAAAVSTARQQNILDNVAGALSNSGALGEVFIYMN